MKKTVPEKQKGDRTQRSLSGIFLRNTILPLIFLSVVVTMVASHLVTKAIQREVRTELSNAADMLETTFDVVYPGDYQLVGTDQLVFTKGDQILSGHHELIDGFKKKTNLDYTVFYQDARVLTTITGDNQQEIEGTGVHPKIVHDVLQQNHEAFYTNVEIKGVTYYAYYRPMYNSDGKAFGMIGIAKPRRDVQVTVWSVIQPIILIALVCLILAIYFSMTSSKKVLFSIRKTELFLEQVAQGNLTARLDEHVLRRKDEIGKMGEAAVTMEHSLRELIELDVLTGLFNRRFGNKKLKETWTRAEVTGSHFVLAIADIDYFKKVNDTYGHECGDLVLKEVAAVFKRNMPGQGSAIRWGGEEFLFLFEDMEQKAALQYLQEILQEVRELQVDYNGKQIRVTITVGLVAGDSSNDMDELVSEADSKLYEGKQAGRDRIMQ